MDFSLCRLDKGEIWVATCWPPVSAIRSVWVPINFSHGGLSLVQRGSPTVCPILRSGGGVYTPLSLPSMAQTYPYDGLIHFLLNGTTLVAKSGVLCSGMHLYTKWSDFSWSKKKMQNLDSLLVLQGYRISGISFAKSWEHRQISQKVKNWNKNKGVGEKHVGAS